MTNELGPRLGRCAADLAMAAQEARWRGPDPYDGLYWKWPAFMVATARRRQLVAQLHARSPLDIRAWRRAPRPRLAKTLALFAKAALLADEVTPSEELRTAGRMAAELLAADRSAGERAWGYPFPVQTRWSGYPANSPNVVVTSFAIDALLLASERLEEPSFGQRARRARRIP